MFGKKKKNSLLKWSKRTFKKSLKMKLSLKKFFLVLKAMFPDAISSMPLTLLIYPLNVGLNLNI
jgi:hypothetical protein